MLFCSSVANDNKSIIYDMMTLAVLALEGVFDTALSTLLDTFDAANALCGTQPRPFDIRLVGVRRRVKTHRGLLLPTNAIPMHRPDAVIVSGLGAWRPSTLQAALKRPDVQDAAGKIAAWSKQGTLVSSACTAAFVLGAAGILNGRRATTSWWLAPYFRQCFPEVELVETQMLIKSGNVITAGAALAHIDLALWFVRQQSPTLARIVARHLVYANGAAQSAFALPKHLAHQDPVVEKFEAWARRHLASFTMRAAARAAGVGERTLERRIKQVLGKSPVSFVQDLRVEQAVQKLQTSSDSLEHIASSVGYSDAATLRALLRRKTGRGVRQLRAG